MIKLLKYLRDYKKESVLGPLFKLLEASFELIVPLVMANIIDIGIKNHDMSYILRCGGILILLGAAGLLFSVTAQYYAAKAAGGFGTGLRNDLFRHISYLSYTEIDEIGTATLLTRMMSDVNQIQSCVNMLLRLFLRSPFIVVGAMAMAFTVNVKAAIVFVVVIPVLLVVVLGITIVTIPLYRKVQSRLDSVLKRVRESLGGVRVVRAFNRQETENGNFDADSSSLLKMQIFAGRISAVMNPLTYIIINIAVIAVIWVGGQEVDSGIITQGAVVALLNYMSQILVELIKLSNLIIQITKAFACANRVNGIFAVKTGIPVTEKEDNDFKHAEDIPHIVFSGVDFCYKNAKKESLEQITFQAMRGETIGIIGSTGSGKTTLVNLIARFYDDTKGEIRIDGIPVQQYELRKLRGKIGIVPQKPVLFGGTIRENMQWGKEDATDAEISRALETAQAAAFVKEYREGLDTVLTQGGKNLSGGQRQRLTIARALVKQPEILILDDSASALDFATDARLRQALRQAQADTTVFLVSQRVSTVMNADRILVMEDGTIVGNGRHTDLAASCEVYQEICISQGIYTSRESGGPCLSQEEVSANV